MNYLKTASRTTEVDAVSDQIIALYHARPELSLDPYLVATMNTMKRQSEQITEAIKRLKVLNELDDRDEVRDRCVRALGHVLNGYANMPTEFACQHAVELKRVFDNYTMAIVSENYDTGTSFIEFMLSDVSDASRTEHQGPVRSLRCHQGFARSTARLCNYAGGISPRAGTAEKPAQRQYYQSGTLTDH